MPPDARGSQWSDRSRFLYRLSLRLYPPEFREEFGDELLGTLAEVDADARHAKGLLRRLQRRLREAFALLREARRLRRRPTETHVPPSPPPIRPRISAAFDTVSEVRRAARTLLKQPGFTIVAVLVLALGTGANVAIFTLVDNFLFRPLPYRDPDRLVALADVYEGGVSGVGMSEFRDWQQHATLFESLALAEFSEVAIFGDGEAFAERLVGSRVSAEFFDVLGIEPLLGRTFLPGEDLPGQAEVIVLSHRLWQRRFGGDPETIGKVIRLDEGPFTIIGVMPASFYWIEHREAEFFRPFGYTSSGRAQHQYGTVARLAPMASLEAAQEQMTALARQAEQQYADARGWTTIVMPLGDMEAGAVAPPLLVLAGAVGLVLLIACANVAGLMLVRIAARSREISVRAALGASRARLVGQLLIESSVLALVGTGLGLILAFWLLRSSAALFPPGMEFPEALGIDARVLAFSLALSFITTLLFGLAPARRALGPNLLDSLKPSGAPARQRLFLRNVVVIEVGLATVLLIAAGLLLASLGALFDEDLGFDHENLVTLHLRLPRDSYEAPQRVEFVREVLDQVSALPGVASAAATNSLPMSGFFSTNSFDIEGRPTPDEWRQQSAQTCVVTPEYLETMGIALLRGHGLTLRDGESGGLSVVVSESLARRHWPDEDPLGRRIRYQGSEDWLTIVGVAADTRYNGPARESNSTIYLPHARSATTRMFVAVRLDRAGGVAAMIRDLVAEMDADVPVTRVANMGDLVAGTLTLQRFVAALLAGFAGLAVVLSAVGLYGVVAQSVAQQTREIGMRVALGATREQVLRMILLRGLVLTAAGAAWGTLAAAAVSRGLESMLHEVGTTDPLIFVSVPLLLMVVAILASYVPARRAASIDPMEALRSA